MIENRFFWGYTILIGFCRWSLGLDLFWFLRSKYISYPRICFATRPEWLFLPLGWEQFCRWVKNSFAVETKIVFSGGLILHLSFRGIRIDTDWNSISYYVTISNNMSLPCMLFNRYKWKQIILSWCHHFFLWFKILWYEHWYFFMRPGFLFQRGCDSASTGKTYFHADHPTKIPWSTVKRCHADLWGKQTSVSV